MARSKQYGENPYHEVEVDCIDDNPHQPRKTIDQARIGELAESITAVGLLHPIIVKRHPKDEQRYTLCGGQRRLLAFRMLERKTIPIIVTETGEPDEIALIENLQREELHPLDQAEALARMKTEHGYTDKNLADKIFPKSRGTVTELLQLCDLPEDIKQECRAFDIPKSHLLAIARMEPEAQRKTWEEIKAGAHLTAREIQQRKRQARIMDAEVPKELRPIVRFIATGTKLLEPLRSIKPAALTDHRDKLDALRGLHQEIGRVIKALQKGERRAMSEPQEDSENTPEAMVQ